MQMPMPPPPFPGASTSPNQGFMDFPSLDGDSTNPMKAMGQMPMPPPPVPMTGAAEGKTGQDEISMTNASNPLEALQKMLIPQANEMMQ